MKQINKPFVIFSLIGIFYSTLGIFIEKEFIIEDFNYFLIGRGILSVVFVYLLIVHLLNKKTLKKVSELFLITIMIYAIHGQWFIPMYYLAYAEAILLIPLLLPIRLDFLKKSFVLGFFAIITSIIYSPASYIEDPIFKQKFIFDSIISILIFSVGTYLIYKYNLKFRKEKDKLFNKFINIGKDSSFIIHDFKGLISTPKFYIEYLRKIIETENQNTKDVQEKILNLVKKLEVEIKDIQEYSCEISQLTLPKNNIGNEECLVEDIIKSIRIIFRKQLDGILLDYQPKDTFYFNKNKMKRVMSNIILNSIESLKENKTENPKIIISVKDDVITVRDNGLGFPKKILKTLNNSNLEFISTKEGGSGLGLSVVKDFMNQDNCNVIFKNEEGAVVMIDLSNVKRNIE